AGRPAGRCPSSRSTSSPTARSLPTATSPSPSALPSGTSDREMTAPEMADRPRVRGGDAAETELDRLVAWLDERTGLAGVAQSALRKVFPDHWSFLLGAVALFCYVVIVVTGVVLPFFFP